MTSNSITGIAVLSSDQFCFLKANILINQGGHACLADFGLLTIVSDPKYSTTSVSLTTPGTTRWMSPELLNPHWFNHQYGQPTKESDCYALGMVTLEVLSGQAPFAQYKDLDIVWKVIKGEHPGRPKGVEGAWFTDDLWGMLELCWATQPTSRPSAEAMLECFIQVSRVWKLVDEIDEE